MKSVTYFYVHIGPKLMLDLAVSSNRWICTAIYLMFPAVLIIAQVNLWCQIIRSVVLVCCDLLRSLPEFLDKWYSSLLGEL